MSPKPITVQIGQPLADLPEPAPKTTPPAAHWMQIAEVCRQRPGMWLPVQIGSLTVNRHRQVPKEIRSGQLFAFREGRWDAACRNGQLYVRYLGEATVTPISKAVS
jgi:hypothetical protein